MATSTVRRWSGRLDGLMSGRLLRDPLGRAAALALLLPLLVSPGASTAPDGSERMVTLAQQHGERPDAADSQDPEPTSGEERRGPIAVAGDRIVDAKPVVAESVETVRPDLHVRPEGGLDPQGLFQILAVDGIRHIASAVELPVTATVGDTSGTLDLLVVDVAAFRPLTPAATAQSAAVWERLLDGEIVVRHDVAQQMGIPLGGDIKLAGPDGTTLSVRVGAFASNGSPPVAEALVPWSVGSRLGAGAPNLVIVAVEEGQEPQRVGSRIAELVGGADVERVEPPTKQKAQLVGRGATRFEPFSYVSHGDGMITIDPAWVRKWIVSAEVPIFRGHVRCHRAMVPQLVAALREVQAAGLDRYIDPSQYGGCWVPRHILFEPSNPLSMHAWGLAIDFNVSTNQYGARPQMHPGIVEIFERWGFRWGGHWSTPDGMHFELRAVVQP